MTTTTSPPEKEPEYDMWFLKPAWEGTFRDYSTPNRLKRRVEFIGGVACIRGNGGLIKQCHVGPWIPV